MSILGLWAAPAFAQPADPEFEEILSHDISDLMVTSVAKRAQRLSDTAAAVYVITQEELRRTGIYSIPEALRLVPGMQVAKLSADQWAVAARGFNSTLSNKLLVLIDGRAIYTPVYSGVYWGDQSTSINDIDRIEVIRGPGASLYGANAVNGVVNIITKSAEDTQGNLLSATTTAKGNGLYEARHGGRTGDNDYWRTYGQYLYSNSWYRGRGGFRMDGRVSDGDGYTLQGDAYSGSQDATLTLPAVTSTNDVYGGNILGRWNHKISGDSELSLQAYADHYSRQEVTFDQHVSTADIQLQHSLRYDSRNNFIWGAGARLYYEDLVSTPFVSVNERYDTHEILNVFLQDEFAILPDEMYLTLGSKLEYNDFTGFEVQPSARLAWHFTQSQTVWAAVSRAVRTPSSIEEDISLGSSTQRAVGNPNQDSEKLIAYELGHRIQATRTLSFDTALFFNDYTKLQTLNTPTTSGGVTTYLLSNLGYGHTYGGEFTANWNVTGNWRLAGSYSYLKMNLTVKPGAFSDLESGERLAPRHQFSAQSFYNITDTVHWDNMVYFVDHISSPVGSYVRYDTRIAWMIQPGIEVSFIGRNLADPHPEFPATPQRDIGRSYIGQILWKF